MVLETITSSSLVQSEINIKQTINEDGNNISSTDHYNPSVREINIPKLPNGSCGFHLSRSKWDPYPWISGVDKNSTADISGLRNGDCVLEVNGEDILGLRIADVANLVKNKAENVVLLLWTSGHQPICNPDSLCCGPMPQNLDRLSVCLQNIISALECPICLDIIPPPAIQCINGHLVCVKCKARSEKCSVCRQKYCMVRSLVSEQVYNSIRDAFRLKDEDGKLKDKLFGVHCRKLAENAKIVQSHTHKFLARIMGKASSLDNLSNKKDCGSTTDDNIVSKRKPLSLSANEIFRANSSAPSSRSTSPHRLTPEIGSQIVFGTRRPPSTNVSAESLVDEDANIQLNVPASHYCNKMYHCPSGINCTEKIRSSDLLRHTTSVHLKPIITFGTPFAEICLPPKPPVDSSCMILILDQKSFWLKLDVTNEQYFVTALIQGSNDDAASYYVEVKICNNPSNKINKKEIIARCAVYSMEINAWQAISENNNGAFVTHESISSTFNAELDIFMRVTIKHI